MTPNELQLSAIKMLSGIDSNKCADTIEKITKPTNNEWTEEQEREAFLYTSKVNSAKIFAKYL